MNRLLAGVALLAATIAVATPARAGNIFLTGHDTDYHMFVGSASAKAAMIADLAYVRNGSTLPVLVLDANGSAIGLELDADLTTLGVAHTTIDPNGTLTASMFDPLVYSAIAVASMVNCGGCDLTASALANIATQSAAIASFFNAGGGILGFSGADDANAYAYAYVPQAATNAGGFPPASPFVETAAGTAAGLVAENGDPTHNYFGTPGVGGLSASYQVAETNGGNNESLFLTNGTISCDVTNTCTITDVPEPASMLILGASLLGLGAVRRRRG